MMDRAGGPAIPLPGFSTNPPQKIVRGAHPTLELPSSGVGFFWPHHETGRRRHGSAGEMGLRPFDHRPEERREVLATVRQVILVALRARGVGNFDEDAALLQAAQAVAQ